MATLTTAELKKKYGSAYNPLNGLVAGVLTKRVENCNAGETAGFDPDTFESLVKLEAIAPLETADAAVADKK